MSVFILGLAVPYTREVIRDAGLIELSERDNRRFLEALDDDDSDSSPALIRAAGYSAPTVLNHFGSKEGLIYAICEEDFQALCGRFEKMARVADPVERLRKTSLAYVDFAMSNPNHYRFMFMTNHPIPEAGALSFDRANPDQDAYAFLRSTVAEAIASGRFREDCDDPEMVAQILWSGVHGLVSLHLTKADDPCLAFRPVKASARLMVDVTIRGFLREEG